MKRKPGRPRKEETKVTAFRVLKKHHSKFIKEVKPIAKKYQS